MFHSRSKTPVQWYVRIGLYLALLLVTAYALQKLRGKIPQAFGMTPIRVRALSVERIPGSMPADPTKVAICVTVRIIGHKDPPVLVYLRQFQLKAASGNAFRPYASSLPFDSLASLHVARAETLDGVFLFNIPAEEQPQQLWWNP
jgi:hypothetical protein